MKNFQKPPSLKSSILLALVLALLCVGTVELAVCAWQEPELFAKITAPVRSAAQQVSQTGQDLWTSWSTSARESVHTSAGEIKAVLEELTLRIQSPSEPEENIQLVDGGTVTPPPRARASFEITALAARHGQEYLTGGAFEVVYYNQTAEPWAGEPYGTDHIGGYGCGPTAMAMAVSSMTDTKMNPAEMAQYCVDNRYWARGHGSYHSIVPGVAEAFGLVCTPLAPEETDEDTLTRYLSSGCLIVALMGKGHFTNRGHFILLRGVALDGTILVADPASTERSLITWDAELIMAELSARRDNGAPLWLLSQDPL